MKKMFYSAVDFVKLIGRPSDSPSQIYTVFNSKIPLCVSPKRDVANVPNQTNLTDPTT